MPSRAQPTPTASSTLEAGTAVPKAKQRKKQRVVAKDRASSSPGQLAALGLDKLTPEERTQRFALLMRQDEENHQAALRREAAQTDAIIVENETRRKQNELLVSKIKEQEIENQQQQIKNEGLQIVNNQAAAEAAFAPQFKVEELTSLRWKRWFTYGSVVAAIIFQGFLIMRAAELTPLLLGSGVATSGVLGALGLSKAAKMLRERGKSSPQSASTHALASSATL